MADKPLDKILLSLDKRNRVHDLLKDHCGVPAEGALLTSSSEYVLKLFDWDGVSLRVAGEVATPELVKQKLTENNLGFLFPEKKVHGDSDGMTKVDPVLVEEMRAGSITARGSVFRALNGDNDPKSALAAIELLLAGKDSNGNTDPAHSTNPFLKLRDPKTGKPDPVVQEQVTQMIRRIGAAKTAAIAKAAGRSLDGRPLR